MSLKPRKGHVLGLLILALALLPGWSSSRPDHSPRHPQAPFRRSQRTKKPSSRATCQSR